MRPGIGMLEGRALLATLQFVEPGSVVGAQLAIGDQTNAQTVSPGKPSLEAHANITVDDASGNGVTVNGTPYTTYSDDGVASADLKNVGSSSFSVQNDLTLAGGYPLTVSDQIGTSTGAEGSVPGSFVTLEIVPDPSDPVNMSYQINLSANYTSSQETPIPTVRRREGCARASSGRNQTPSTVSAKRKGTKMIDIVFNEPMNPATAGAAGDFIVVTPEKVHGKKAHRPKSTPVAFSVQYNPADDGVSLILRKPTKRPLQVTVRKVVFAVNGLRLGSDYTVGVQ
jgi:hypothetical protein